MNACSKIVGIVTMAVGVIQGATAAIPPLNLPPLDFTIVGHANGALIEQRARTDAKGTATIVADSRASFRDLAIESAWSEVQFKYFLKIYRPTAGVRIVESIDGRNTDMLGDHIIGIKIELTGHAAAKYRLNYSTTTSFIATSAKSDVSNATKADGWSEIPTGESVGESWISVLKIVVKKN